jgi:hypothetical protein
MSENNAPVYRICEHITARAVDGEVFIMDLRSLRTYALNKTAAFVWSLIDGGRSRDDICRVVLDRYDVAPEAACVEVADLLATLATEQLISTAAPDA